MEKMIKHKFEVVENATNVSNINPTKPFEQVVADCMKDYLEYRRLEEQGVLLKLSYPIGQYTSEIKKLALIKAWEILYNTDETDLIEAVVEDYDVVMGHHEDVIESLSNEIFKQMKNFVVNK